MFRRLMSKATDYAWSGEGGSERGEAGTVGVGRGGSVCARRYFAHSSPAGMCLAITQFRSPDFTTSLLLKWAGHEIRRRASGGGIEAGRRASSVHQPTPPLLGRGGSRCYSSP